MNLYDFKKSFYSGVIFFGTVAILSIGYSLVGNLSVADKVGSGSGLTASSWNKIVDGILDLDTRVVTIETTAKTVEMWSVKNTGNVGQTATWTAIPGLSKTFTLSRPAMVQLLSGGVQRNVTGTCHVGYRYVVDGVARGNTWGQQVQVSTSATWHSGWNLIEAENLSAGSHTISIEAKNQATTDWCYICAEVNGNLDSHDGCTLNINAFYQ